MREEQEKVCEREGRESVSERGVREREEGKECV